MKYTLDNGWEIAQQKDGSGILYITPIPDTIFQTAREVKIPKEVMIDIARGERNIGTINKIRSAKLRLSISQPFKF